MELARVIGELQELQNDMKQMRAQAADVPGMGDAIAAMDESFKETVAAGRQIVQTVRGLQSSTSELLKTVNAMAATGEKAEQTAAAAIQGGAPAGTPQVVGA